jgi:hypothetical protein
MRWVGGGIHGLGGDSGILNRLNMNCIVRGSIGIAVRYICALLFISYGLDSLLSGLDLALINRTLFLSPLLKFYKLIIIQSCLFLIPIK